MKPKVLFIDDDPLMHRLYQPHIERAGYGVISLLEGTEALAVASREQPQIVVMDMMMPGVDGLAAILLIKAAASTQKIPIIAISSDSNYTSLHRQLAGVGVEVFLAKPFSPVKLVAEIRRLHGPEEVADQAQTCVSP